MALELEENNHVEQIKELKAALKAFLPLVEVLAKKVELQVMGEETIVYEKGKPAATRRFVYDASREARHALMKHSGVVTSFGS